MSVALPRPAYCRRYALQFLPLGKYTTAPGRVRGYALKPLNRKFDPASAGSRVGNGTLYRPLAAAPTDPSEWISKGKGLATSKVFESYRKAGI